MSLYLGLAFLLFILLFFTTREPFYSDTNVSSASDDLTEFNKKLDELKISINGLSTKNLSSMDAVSSVQKILETKDKALYTSGVVSSVQKIKEQLDLFQENVMFLNETLISIPKIVTVQQYDEHKNKTSIPLSSAIDYLSQEANNIFTNLNKIPDS